MAYETSKLLEFTRLFPPLKARKPFFPDGDAGAAAGAVGADGDGDAQDAEGGEEEEDGGIKALQTKSASGGKFKAASYNEIICQVGHPLCTSLLSAIGFNHVVYVFVDVDRRRSCRTSICRCVCTTPWPRAPGLPWMTRAAPASCRPSIAVPAQSLRSARPSAR
jgi:hypothetical protein